MAKTVKEKEKAIREQEIKESQEAFEFQRAYAEALSPRGIVRAQEAKEKHKP